MSARGDPTLVGIDEAGRGAWIGPLVVGALAIDPSDLPRLVAAGAADSKSLSPKAREEVYGRLAGIGRLASVELTPAEVDRSVRRGKLNELEAHAFAELARSFAPAHVHADACDTNAVRFGRTVARLGGAGLTVEARHKADRDDPVVGAASIVAKVRRDRRIRELAERLGCEIGSGYPGDERTVAFVREFTRERRRLPAWLRASWATTQRVIGERPARMLDDRFA